MKCGRCVQHDEAGQACDTSRCLWCGIQRSSQCDSLALTSGENVRARVAAQERVVALAQRRNQFMGSGAACGCYDGFALLLCQRFNGLPNSGTFTAHCQDGAGRQIEAHVVQDWGSPGEGLMLRWPTRSWPLAAGSTVSGRC